MLRTGNVSAIVNSARNTIGVVAFDAPPTYGLPMMGAGGLFAQKTLHFEYLADGW